MEKLNLSEYAEQFIPKVARPNYCGGAICYDGTGKRYRLKCSSDAFGNTALCANCTSRERDEDQKDLARLHRSSPVQATKVRSGRFE